MKAKCPHCQNGCDECHEGFIEVGFATGDIFTRHCKQCGFENGGYITEESQPPEPSGPCVRCGGETDWLLVG